jgi:hypothetical protein
LSGKNYDGVKAASMLFDLSAWADASKFGTELQDEKIFLPLAKGSPCVS